MGEPIYTTIHVRFPARWGEPWFVERIREQVCGWGDDISPAAQDTSVSEVSGELNYGVGNNNIGPALAWLTAQRIPFSVSEGSGPEWSGSWALFDSVTLWRGVGDDEPMMDYHLYRSIIAGDSAYSSVEHYFDIGTRVIWNSSCPLMRFDHLPAACPPEPEELPLWSDF